MADADPQSSAHQASASMEDSAHPLETLNAQLTTTIPAKPKTRKASASMEDSAHPIETSKAQLTTTIPAKPKTRKASASMEDSAHPIETLNAQLTTTIPAKPKKRKASASMEDSAHPIETSKAQLTTTIPAKPKTRKASASMEDSAHPLETSKAQLTTTIPAKPKTRKASASMEDSAHPIETPNAQLTTTIPAKPKKRKASASKEEIPHPIETPNAQLTTTIRAKPKTRKAAEAFGKDNRKSKKTPKAQRATSTKQEMEKDVDAGFDIPPIVNKPDPDADAGRLQREISEDDLVFFDIETTGFVSLKEDIIRIGAVGSAGRFNCYVTPGRPVQKKATDQHGIRFENGIMYHNGRRVKSVSITEALNRFMAFLGRGGSVLAGYSSGQFDSLYFVQSAVHCEMFDSLKEYVAGFVDIYDMLKRKFPKRRYHNQLSMYKSLVGEEPTGNALSPGKLRRLYNAAKIPDVFPYTLTADFVRSSMAYREQKAKNLETWERLIDKHISRGQAECAAGSGLRVGDLTRAYRQGGRYAVEYIVTGVMADLKPRVMKHRNKIEQLMAYF